MLPLRSLLAAGAASLAASIILFAWYWRDGLPYDATSGVWMALANDAANGTFYRPLHSADGYGGTRYMPLFFLLHALLIRAGVPVVASGILLTLASLVLLVAGVYLLLRRYSVPAAWALATAALLFASTSLQLLMLAVKGDLLAVALNVLGLGVALSARERTSRHALAALLWVLAFAVKFSALFAPAAFVLCRLLEKRTRPAFISAALLGVGAMAVVAGANVFSSGRMLESFGLLGSGGAQPGYVWKAPWWLLRALAQDPFLAAIAVAALVLAYRRVQRQRWDLLTIWLALSWLGTLVIFASPGTDTNHFMDLLAASVVLIGVELYHERSTFARRFVTVFAVATVVSLLPGVPSVRQFFLWRGHPTAAGLHRVRDQLGPRADGAILAEHPLVPMLWRRPVEVLDPFALRLLAARDRDVRREFEQKLANRHYSAVVLIDWSGAPLAELPAAMRAHGSAGVAQFYGDVYFPAGFLDSLERSYRLAFFERPFVVLTPLPQ